MNEWIRITEKMPPIDDKCPGFTLTVLLTNMDTYDIGYFEYRYGWHCERGEVEDPTHWMLLPELPKEER